MKTFKIKWEIDIDAESPREAAEKALAYQRDSEGTAVVFDVIEPFGGPVKKTHRIDLMETSSALPDLQSQVAGMNGLTIEGALAADWGAVHGSLIKARECLQKDGVRHTWLDGAIGVAESRAKVPVPDAYLRRESIETNESAGAQKAELFEQAAETTEAGHPIQARLRQACEHKIALHVDAACDVVGTDPVEADAWAYEAGKEAWEFDLQAPEELASHPALSAAFKRGFDSVEQQARSQREVAGITVHNFEGTPPSEVYGQTQADDSIKDGDVLNLGNGNVAVLMKAWPTVVLGEIEGFHRLASGVSFESIDDGKYAASAARARELESNIGNKCPASIEAGQIHLEDGTCIDLLKIQQTCNEIFQDTGDRRAVEAADDLSKLTGVWQGPHGDWLENMERPRG